MRAESYVIQAEERSPGKGGWIRHWLILDTNVINSDNVL